MNQLASVIIPAKNRADLVKRAIKSVLDQDYPLTEIIVVDDGSEENLESLLQKEFPAIKFLRNSDSIGGAAARNAGAKIASGEYIAFLDSDDEWKKDHLSSKIDFMNAHSCAGVFGCFYLKTNDSEKEITFDTDSYDQIGDKILGKDRFDARTSTFVFRREKFNLVRFDDDLLKHQDWDLAIRFANKFQFLFHNYPSTIIHVEGSDRMSGNLNYEGSSYFLKKNAHYLTGHSILIFCIKLWWKGKSFDIADSKKFLMLADKYAGKMRFIDKSLLALFKTGIVNPTLLYKMKKLLYK